MRPRFHHRRHHACAVGAFDRAAHDRQAERYRLLLENTDLFRARHSRIQLGPRAPGRDRALVDVSSPCVTFNDHTGSTKSYLYTRKHMQRTTEADFVPPASEILATIGKNGTTTVTMHDGSVVRFNAVPKDYDPTDRQK